MIAMDDWQTVSEVSAAHSVHITASSLGPLGAGSQGWDRFTFTIKLDDVRRKLDERRLLLAIRYSIDGGSEWWDSNDGANYRFAFNKIKTIPAFPPAAAQKTAAKPRPKPFNEGGAFLPLLEAQGIIVKPHSTAPLTPVNTHGPLSRLGKSAMSTGWTFPVTPPASSPPSTTDGIQVSASSSSTPIMLKNYCPPTSPPAVTHPSSQPSTVASPADFTQEPTSLPVQPISGPIRVRHHRRKTWDADDTVALETNGKQGVSHQTNLQPAISPVPFDVTLKKTLHPTVVSSDGFPSPPRSADQSPRSPSPSPSPLPETPNSARLESSPGIIPFDLPMLHAGSTGRLSQGGAPPGERGRLAEPSVKLGKGSSYADL